VIVLANTEKPRVVVVCDDAIGPTMAGPAIRSWELCQALLPYCQPTLVVADDSRIPSDAPFPIVPFRGSRWGQLMSSSTAVISQGQSLWLHHLLFSPVKHIVDLYDPVPLELLQHGEGRRGTFQRRKIQDRLETLLRFGDHFVCACEEQRDFWLGALSSLGRVNPLWKGRDPSFRSLIDIVPFGIPAEEPKEDPNALARIFPELPANAQVLWWGGGIWDWLDPLTLIRAMARLRETHPELHLVFPGVRHPNPSLARHAMVEKARELARALGLESKGVWFGQGWLPYGERGACLKRAVAGVSMHRSAIESRFSFRTRLLDYLWAGIPVIASGGDPLGERAKRDGWGLIVEPGDEDALVDALTRFAEEEDLRRRLRQRGAEAREAFRWERVVQPLVSMIRDERRAPDRAGKLTRIAWWLRQSGPLICRAVWYGQWGSLSRGAKKLLHRSGDGTAKDERHPLSQTG
jgi:glycosyltransferase involved in cell wall biosynthesis